MLFALPPTCVELGHKAAELHNVFQISVAFHRECQSQRLLVGGCTDLEALCIPPVRTALVAVAING